MAAHESSMDTVPIMITTSRMRSSSAEPDIREKIQDESKRQSTDQEEALGGSAMLRKVSDHLRHQNILQLHSTLHQHLQAVAWGNKVEKIILERNEIGVGRNVEFIRSLELRPSQMTLALLLLAARLMQSEMSSTSIFFSPQSNTIFISCQSQVRHVG
ncbi:hypothetical protein EYF80_015091 [Liparis tanakae]|uniref:Uncharacterized protein n=1 Tax=Liparis tanakae TaxID=230148 RepID=A0A4Z2ICG2_9TELE|nr:hypothetical protein EYF80_015091 [Liparis tanakae]